MLEYIIFRAANSLVGHLPYPVLYWLAARVAWILENVIRYRKDVLEKNLAKCFPDLSETELKKIGSENYLNLAVVLLETFKGNIFSKNELNEHFKIENEEILDQSFEKGRDIMIVTSHFNNWEWAALAIGRLKFDSWAVYKPLKNKRISDYIVRSRERTGLQLLPIKMTRKITEPHGSLPRSFMFIADQSPSNMKDAIWVDFLGRKTPCLHGPEKYARKMDLDVYFASIYREQQGYYKLVFRPVTKSPNETPYGFITKSFMGMLEHDVRQSPSDWVWTHKRWKRVKEDQ